MDARKDFPSSEIQLNTQMGKAQHFKTDVYRGIMWYIISGKNGSNIVPLSIEKIKETIELNKKGEVPEVTALKTSAPVITELHEYTNVVGQESLTRFDAPQEKKKKKKKKRKFTRPNETV
jgi:hypothetical protein